MTLLACVEPVRPVSRNFDRAACGATSTDISVNTLNPVDKDNVSEYMLEGKCGRKQAEVLVNIEGNPLSQYPICDNTGRWRVVIDVSGLVNKKERFQVAISQGSVNRNMHCQNVENFFVCPSNYIAVSEPLYLNRYTNRTQKSSFCVMKFEAKVKSGSPLPTRLGDNTLVKAESLANGDLITRVTEDTAIQFCKQNGPGYDLINNDEWQLIAYHIEDTPENWSNNTTEIIAGNRLNIGFIGSGAQSSSNTDDEQSRWSLNKRSHQLLNNEYIWDFSGNLWEIVQHHLTGISNRETYTGFVHEMPQSYRRDFGPRREYTIFNVRERTNLFGGLGYILGNAWGGTILRGGNQWRTAGVFSADVRWEPDRARRIDVGFRCVYYP